MNVNGSQQMPGEALAAAATDPPPPILSALRACLKENHWLKRSEVLTPCRSKPGLVARLEVDFLSVYTLQKRSTCSPGNHFRARSAGRDGIFPVQTPHGDQREQEWAGGETQPAGK